MKKILVLSLILSCLAQVARAQSNSVEINNKKGVLYMGFGTNRSFYTRNDISFKGSNFDFTLEKVSAKDDGGLKFDNGGAAQYSYQVGYYFKTKNFGVEFNFDHIKYFMRQNQVVHLNGIINNKLVQKDTLITPAFIEFEHSDGANYALFNFVKWKTLSISQNKKNTLDLVGKAGIGPVIPKTNSTIMGKHSDDAYKVSGFVIALEGGVRYNFLKNFYVAPSFKGSFANYSHFKIADGHGNQHWFGAHFNLLVGAQVNL